MRHASLLLLALLGLLAGCAGNDVTAPAPASPTAEPAAAVEAVRAAAIPLTGADGDYDALLRVVGDARVVMLGEASHGTHEFYRERTRITQRLVREKGFMAVAVEGDWPDALRVNRYVRGAGTDRSAGDALQGFADFPTWMWRNQEVVELVEWLRQHNRAAPHAQAGFYGLDVYSLFPSIDEVLAYLRRADPGAEAAARERYNYFRRFDRDVQAYGQSVELGSAASCEREVAEPLAAQFDAVIHWDETRAVQPLDRRSTFRPLPPGEGR